ncbi:MAG: hypothetical protein R3C56_27530 [Pirellulaceae bacterium]
MEFKELAQAKIRAILRSATQHGKSLQQVDYSDQAIEELVRLHSRFATYSALPATGFN